MHRELVESLIGHSEFCLLRDHDYRQSPQICNEMKCNCDVFLKNQKIEIFDFLIFQKNIFSDFSKKHVVDQIAWSVVRNCADRNIFLLTIHAKRSEMMENEPRVNQDTPR